MIPKLVILSDLWGKQKSDWTSLYISQLSKKFDVVYYDCCDLGRIDTTIYTQENLHQQFTDGGIEKAVDHLYQYEKEAIDILAFSIGGTIAWKAISKGLTVRSLYAVSATRLRYETVLPKISVHLYYGGNDAYKPTNEWFSKMNISPTIIDTQTHDMYTDISIAKSICADILATKNTE